MISDLAFYVVATLTVLFTVGVVAARNMLHAAIFLVASFTTTAILYLLLHAEFAAIMQVVIYIGGIVVVIVFIILLTSELGEAHLEATWLRRLSAWPLALAWVAAAGWLVRGFAAQWSDRLPADDNFASMERLGTALLAADSTGFLLPFEIISLLLLAAVIGAIVIARRHDQPGDTPR